MTTLKAKVPESLARQVEKLAKQEKVSVDQLVSLALAAQVSAWVTRDSVEARAGRGSWEKFDKAMAHIPNVEPAAHDRR